MSNCLFCKIATKEIPATILYEDEDVLVFNDIKPQAQVHFLVIPKIHIESTLDLENSHQQLIGKIMLICTRFAKEHGLSGGYKTHINTGINGGQEVPHLHIHVYGNK